MPTGIDNEVDLATLEFWPSDAVRRLRENWITTAEQVVGIAATSNGISALAEQTRLTESELRRLIDLTGNRLPVSIRRRLSSPVDTSQFGLGALTPAKSGKQQ